MHFRLAKCSLCGKWDFVRRTMDFLSRVSVFALLWLS